MIESDAEENRNENEGGEIEEEERVEPEENMTEPKNCESDGRSESGDGVEEETEEQDEKMEGKRMGSRRSSTTLKFLMVEQSERLGARNDPSLWRKGATGSCLHPRQRRSLHESEDSVSELEEEDDQDDNEMSVVTRWGRYLRMLPVDFFNSSEARMQQSGTSQAAASLAEDGVEDGGYFNSSRRRCVPYAGLAICHEPENCPDLRYVYEQVYEIRIRRGGRKEGYYQFRAVAGQLARFAVAVDIADASSFAHVGGLFELATMSNLLRAFIGGFQANAQASTVYSKATLLGGLCRMAKLHFGKIAHVQTAAVLSRIDETANLLGGFRRIEKATSRRQTAVRRDENRRETFINQSDWYTLQRRIEEDMRAVWSGVGGLVAQFGEDTHAYMDENHGLVRKYSLLLLVFILLTGAGQRPQAYCSLQHPSENVLRRWEENEEADCAVRSQEGSHGSGDMGNGGDGTVKLYPTQEKTPRGTFYPGIVFTNTARAFFIAYARIIRPAVMRATSRESADALDPDRPFMVHTEKGRALSGESIRNTLRYYIGGLGGLSGDLSRVTVMTLRASFASIMFRSFRRGKFPGRSSEEFLSELAEVMNTSTEMLRTTYIATNGKEFDEAASAFLRASREE
jgi:hypothetical protein